LICATLTNASVGTVWSFRSVYGSW